MGRRKSEEEHRVRIGGLIGQWGLEVLKWPDDIYDPALDVLVRCVQSPAHRPFPIRVASIQAGKLSHPPEPKATKCYECRHGLTLPEEGAQYGLLTVQSIIRIPTGNYQFQCRCDCGTETPPVPANHVLQNQVRSCGSNACKLRLRGHVGAQHHVGKSYGYMSIAKVAEERTSTGNAQYIARCNAEKCHQPGGNERQIYDSQLRGPDRRMNCPCGAWSNSPISPNVIYALPDGSGSNNASYTYDIISDMMQDQPDQVVSKPTFYKRLRRMIGGSDALRNIEDNQPAKLETNELKELIKIGGMRSPKISHLFSMKYCVYRITRIHDGRQYVGYSAYVDERVSTHLTASSNRALRDSVKKYGVDAHRAETIYEFDDFHEAAEKEVELIEALGLVDHGFNEVCIRAGDAPTKIDQETEEALIRLCQDKVPIRDIAVALDKDEKQVRLLVAMLGRRHNRKQKEGSGARVSIMGKTMRRPLQSFGPPEQDEIKAAIGRGVALVHIRDKFAVREGDLIDTRRAHIHDNPSQYSASGRRLSVPKIQRQLIGYMYLYGWSLREIVHYASKLPLGCPGRTSLSKRLKIYLAECPVIKHEDIKEYVDDAFSDSGGIALSKPGCITKNLGYWQQAITAEFVARYAITARVSDIYVGLDISRDQAYQLRRNLLSGDIDCREGVQDLVGISDLVKVMRSVDEKQST